MPDFSNIVMTPEVRAIVQEGYLERAFHDGLFPAMIFRGDVVAKAWPVGAGDTYIASAPGLIPPSGRPLRPGTDPEPLSYAIEQWEAQLNTYAGTIDTNIPTSVQAIVDLLLRNSHQLGLQAAQTLNRLVRNRFYNAAESGWTVANGGATSTSLVVKRLNGFTKARNPASANGSRVRFSTVSSSNPLQISIAGTTRNVIGFTPAVAGDEIGPGTLLLDSSHTWSDRDYVQAVDRSEVVFVGGGNKVDDLGVTDLPRLQDLRNCVMRLRRNNIPTHPDGNYHAHLDPVTLTALMADTEIQRMLTGRPENYMYSDFVIGKMLGVVFVDNNECPTKLTVEPRDGVTFSLDDAFAHELTRDGTASGMEVHRLLITGYGGIEEYYQDPAMFITEAGMVGKMGEVQVNNNGIEVSADRVKLIMRAPLNRLQDMVATSWRFDGDWPQRTDAATGTAARYKRQVVLCHGFDG